MTTQLDSDNDSDHLDNVDHDDTNSLSDVESGSTAGTQSGDDLKQDVQETIHKNEERAVHRAKCIVGVSIFLCATSVVLAVFFSKKKSDQRSFDLAYDGLVKDISALVVWEVRYNFALMEQLSSQITIAAGLMQSGFPFHTEPQYEITGGFVDGMGGIMSAAFAPLITHDQRTEWEEYSVQNQGWIESSKYLKQVHPVHRDALHGTIQDHEHDRRVLQEEQISSFVYKWDAGQKVQQTSQPGLTVAPIWQVSPADAGTINVDLLSDSRISALYATMLQTKASVLSRNTEIYDMFDFLFDPEEKQFKSDPHGFIMTPVFTKIEDKEDQELAGVIIGVTPYGNLLDRLIPTSADGGIIGVFKDHCGNVMSFKLSSTKAYFLGYEDAHDPAFDDYLHVEHNIEMYLDKHVDVDGLCHHDLYLYPTSVLKDNYASSALGTYLAILGIAVALAVIFVAYDYVVTRRQNSTMQSAMRTRAIVASLFPERIARKLVHEAHQDAVSKKQSTNKPFQNTKSRLESFMKDQGEMTNKESIRASKPIAELFPEATVMFGDLVGFTAWSSQREPHQVFTLLETIYAAFDEIAARRKVFKVETIGDCYVAVCGVPNPNKNHCSVMARFAHECFINTVVVLRQLEVELGPDTAELGIRIGLHSGPVTAGVLRGERARFQLFGDTVNTTARIEGTGEKNRIHVSEETARRLIAAGKSRWVTRRANKIVAKGKGELETYWLNLNAPTGSASEESAKVSDGGNALQESPCRGGRKVDISNLSEAQRRIVEWNADLLQRQLRLIIAYRQVRDTPADTQEEVKSVESVLQNPDRKPLDEVQDVIMLPKYSATVERATVNTIELDEKVKVQLHDFVKTIAQMYHHNPFHNYEHASHVTMSCLKLLSRVVGPDINTSDKSKTLHDHTYGITSDPLTQFSVVFSGMIHDVDHPGVPNVQLEKEHHDISKLYCHKSAAEQNSVDVAWSLLMEDRYTDLRRAIYATKEELKRFRQLVVNAVMATDIMDKDLGVQRKARWKKAFAEEITHQEHRSSSEEDVNRKATIVIEHLIQASDVAHTMQHWHVYHRWNERLYRESYAAYKAGRVSTDPTEGWYDGEIGFFDFYIIPLAKKLKNCGVFGVSSDECLSYAQQNRDEWVQRGKQTVAEYAQRLREEEGA